MSVTIEHLHKAGAPMAEQGRLSAIIAKRHYASIAQSKGGDNEDVLDWLTRTMELLSDQTSFARLIQAGKIETTLWITVFICSPVPVISVNSQILQSASSLDVQILIENCNKSDADGIPEKTWP